MDIGSLIRKEFKASGFDLHQEQVDSLSHLLKELKRWNRRMNLTGLKTDEAMVRVLLLGSAAFLSAHSFSGGQRIMDLGSGGGFPGIPLKVLSPELEVTLVEAREKKVAFLKHIVRQLKLADTHCLRARAEELGARAEMRGRFDVVTARAAGKLSPALCAAAPLLSDGGLFITLKGTDYASQVEAAGEAASGNGMEFLRVVSPRWAGEEQGIHLLVFKKGLL